MVRHARLGLLLWVLCAAPLAADGMFLGRDLDANNKPSSAAQKAVLIRDAADEVLLLQTTYQGPASRFAWVVPVPSRPTDVFLAEPAFLEQVFRRSQPDQQTTISANWRFAPPPPARGSDLAPPPPGAPGGAGGPSPTPPPVTVLARMDVGEFDATILAATQAGALQQWLARHGYALPEAATPVLADYVRQRWVFVALKMQEGAVDAKPLLADVPPLGLRFRADKLVYPLLISRVSAPPLSAILLGVIGPNYFTCETLPEAKLPQADLTLGEYRRQMARPGGQPALLRETCASPALPWADLSYRQADWPHRTRTALPRQRVSRFFCLLQPEEMRDLEFVPDAQARDHHLVVTRQGWASRSAFAAFHRRPLKLLREKGASATFTVPAPRLTPAGLALSGWGWMALVAVALAVLTVVARRQMARRTVSLTLLVLLATLVFAGGHGGGGLEDDVDRLLSLVERAAGQFRADTGLYPATVADLAAHQAPAAGLDASGNAVTLRGGWQGPYLSYEPPDPLGGAGLVVDPLNARLVDCAGYASTVAVSGRPVVRPEDGFGSDYWSEVPDETVARLQPYADCYRRAPDGWRVLPASRTDVTHDFPAPWAVNERAGLLMRLPEQSAPELDGAGFVTVATTRRDFPIEETSYVVSCSARGARLLSRQRANGRLNQLLWLGPGQALVETLTTGSDPHAYEAALARIDLVNGQQTVVHPGPASRIALDRRRQVLYLLRSSDPGPYELVRMPVVGGEPRPLARGLHWSLLEPTAKGVIVGKGRRVMEAGFECCEIVQVGEDGRQTSLAKSDEMILETHWSPQRLTYLTHREDGTTALHWLDLRTGVRRDLPLPMLAGLLDDDGTYTTLVATGFGGPAAALIRLGPGDLARVRVGYAPLDVAARSNRGLVDIFELGAAFELPFGRLVEVNRRLEQ